MRPLNFNFTVQGNHPTGKYVDWIAIGLDQLTAMVIELATAGYETTIKPKVEDAKRYSPQRDSDHFH